MSTPTDYPEWRDRRNSIAMDLCTAVRRAKGGVCSCYNGDSDPDTEHFDSCRRHVAVADNALKELGVPVPSRFVVEACDTGTIIWDTRASRDRNIAYRISPVGSWFYTNNRGRLWSPIKDRRDVPQPIIDALAEYDRKSPVTPA